MEESLEENRIYNNI